MSSYFPSSGVPIGAVLIDEMIPTGAVSTEFFNIPQNYRHLLFVCKLRGAQAVTGSGIRFRFNNDSGSNYNFGFIDVSNATFAGTVGNAQSYIHCGRTPGASAPSNYVGSFSAFIPDYRGSNNKVVHAQHFCMFGTASTDLRYGNGGGIWLSTAAINRILLWHDSGAGQYDVGTHISLYGMM